MSCGIREHLCQAIKVLFIEASRTLRVDDPIVIRQLPGWLWEQAKAGTTDTFFRG
jgi:hypothetical protein